jgi:ribosomal protein S18 acetylase RimI-like enzyme
VTAAPLMTSSELSIRPATLDDVPAVLALGRELVADGTTYFFTPDTTDRALLDYWMAPGEWTFVACRAGEVAGCYVLRRNFPGRSSHVANASYLVGSRHAGHGVGRAMGEHSLAEARARGFAAMQFNLVVSTNAPAVALWKKLGFEVVGTLPRAFDHPRLGRVDAYVMHRFL